MEKGENSFLYKWIGQMTRTLAQTQTSNASHSLKHFYMEPCVYIHDIYKDTDQMDTQN